MLYEYGYIVISEVMDFVLKYEFGKNYLLKQVKSKVMKQTGGLYPAPLKIIDVSTIMKLEAIFGHRKALKYNFNHYCD